MKHITAYVVSLISAVTIAAGCASSPAAVTVSDSGDHVVRVKAGKKFSVHLDSQLSTGYSWKLMEMPDTMTLVEENVITGEKSGMLTGGHEIQEFVLRASKTGGVVIFKYARHWMKKPEYIKTSRITVQAE